MRQLILFLSLSFSLLGGRAFAAGNSMCLDLKDGVTRGCARSFGNDKDCSGEQVAYWTGSCFFESGESPVAELMKLAKGAQIPHALYDKYDSKVIAKTLIYRLYLEKSAKRKASKAPSFDLYKNTEIQMAFDFENLESIFQKGFLNQFQTPNTNGASDKELRNQAESFMVGLAVESDVSQNQNAKVHQVRPKYAYFVPKAAGGIFFSAGYVRQYGEIFAVLKDEVKNRATFTIMDSLGAVYWKKSAGLHTFKDVMTTPYPRTDEYYESQIWGAVSMADVKYLLVNCPQVTEIDLVDLKEILKRKAPHFPVYSCKLAERNGVSYNAPDKLIFGTPNAEYAPNNIKNLRAIYAGKNISGLFDEPCVGSESCDVSLSDLDLPDISDKSKQSLSISLLCEKGVTKNLNVASYAALAKVSLACGDQPSAEAKITQQMKVVAASFGSNVVSAQKANVTDKAAAFCDGKSACEYFISPKYIGDPAPDKPKDFSISWKCFPSGKAHTKSVKADATNTKLELSCAE